MLDKVGPNDFQLCDSFKKRSGMFIMFDSIRPFHNYWSEFKSCMSLKFVNLCHFSEIFNVNGERRLCKLHTSEDCIKRQK